MREDADVETSSDDYARRFAGGIGAFLLEVQARATLELLNSGAAMIRVLDVGGGHAQLTGTLLDAGCRVTVYGSAASCARRVAPFFARGARFVAGDLLRAPFPDRAFDVVVSYRLLPHVGAWRELVAELCRLASRAVLLDYPTLRSVNVFAGGLFGAKRRVEGDTRPFAVFRDSAVDAAFAAAGFRARARRRQFLLPMALHRALGRPGVSRALEGSAAALGLTGLLGSPVIVRAERA
jgi:2-polyprenyl-3-methyl-5-hydroxy-6-metoxy-1,4-benzoquinol methylase